MIQQAMANFNGDSSEVKLGHLFIAAQDLARQVEQRACGIESCRFTFGRGDDGPDSAAVYIGLRKKPAFFNFEHYGYLSRPNCADFQYCIEAFDRLALPEALNKLAKGIYDMDVLDSSAVGARLRYGTGIR